MDFAILTSVNFRQNMRIAGSRHELATPSVSISFKEQAGRGIWTINPEPPLLVDAAL